MTDMFYQNLKKLTASSKYDITYTAPPIAGFPSQLVQKKDSYQLLYLVLWTSGASVGSLNFCGGGGAVRLLLFDLRLPVQRGCPMTDPTVRY